MRRPQKALDTASKVLTRHHVPEVVVSIVACISIVLGIDMATDDDYQGLAAFRTAMRWAPAPTWGAVLIGLSTAVLVTVFIARRDLHWPLYGLTWWYASWASALIISAPDPDVVNSASIIYSGSAVLLSTMSIIYTRENNVRVPT